VVGRQHVEVAVGQRGPERGGVLRGAQRGRHGEARRVRAGVAPVVEDQVVRAALGGDVGAVGEAAHDLRERRAAGDMDDVRRRAGQRRQHEEAVHGLRLELRRSRDRMPGEIAVAAGQELLDDRQQGQAVLAVRGGQHALARRLAQHAVDDAVVGLDAELVVREPQLHARDAEVGERAQVAVAVRLRLPHHAVQADVAARPRQLVGDRPLRRGGRRLARLGVHEAEDRGGAAEQRRRRVGLDRPQRVRVHVDAARQHEAAARVDDVRLRRGQAADRGDAAVLDQHVGVAAAAGGDDLAPGHHQASGH
jgi:hypothetical protein